MGMVTATQLILRTASFCCVAFIMLFNLGLFPPHSFIACLRTKIDAVKHEARKSPRTMMRLNGLVLFKKLNTEYLSIGNRASIVPNMYL